MARNFICAAALLAAATTLPFADAQFDRNVIMLDRNSWKEQLLESPHGWFVNVCRQG